MFAEAISQALTRSDPDFAVCRAESPSDTVRLCRSMAAYAVIMEVTAYTPWRLAERLALRDEIKSGCRCARWCCWWMRSRTPPQRRRLLV